ncbi:MAG: nucleotide sugar dehydrogenase [Bacteroidota bacterium]|jgi:UDP-N-acetyl-D-galactosamine dehydrogenase
MPNTDKKIAVIGLGYVGLPLAFEFSKKYDTIGFDINPQRIIELNTGIDITREIDPSQFNSQNSLALTNNPNQLSQCNIFIVTVPTPVDQHKLPDLSYVLAATKMVGKLIKTGDIVIYESTVYPGCTENDCVPLLETTSGLKYNTDFFCGYSPERINPGDRINTLTKIKKVTSGSTPEIAEQIDQLYASIITAGTFKAKSIKVAEASKAIENAQRDVNISFVNELALIFDLMDIDTSDVLEAAQTKWNFLPFKPGLVGGHCIGVDPYYLAYQAEQLGHTPQVILSGREVNDKMAIFVVHKLMKLMISKNLIIQGANILILGLTFKENCTDIRNSKVIEVYRELIALGMNVDVFDPNANPEQVNKLHNINPVSELKTYDAILLTVAHDQFLRLDFNALKSSPNSVIFDLKSVLPREWVDARL